MFFFVLVFNRGFGISICPVSFHQIIISIILRIGLMFSFQMTSDRLASDVRTIFGNRIVCPYLQSSNREPTNLWQTLFTYTNKETFISIRVTFCLEGANDRNDKICIRRMSQCYADCVLTLVVFPMLDILVLDNLICIVFHHLPWQFHETILICSVFTL